MEVVNTNSCSCNKASKKTASNTKKMSVLNALSAIVFFLFPKCPICWAAYASIFSFIGLENLAYNSKFKYIALGVFLIGSFFIIWKHYKNKSWLNILIYISGISIFLIATSLNFSQTWWIYLVSFLIILSNFNIQNRFQRFSL